MSSLTVLAVTALGLFVFAAFAYGMVVSTRRIMHDDGRLRLEPMLRRHGATLGSTAEHAAYQAAIAARRCVTCRDKARCDAWLASGASEGAEEFCPNAQFVRSAARG